MNNKEIILTDEFFERSFARGIFEKFENIYSMKKFIEIGIKDSGIIVDDSEHGKSSYKCLIMLDNKLISIPFVEEKKIIIVKTVFWSQQQDINKYKSKKQDIDRGETNDR